METKFSKFNVADYLTDEKSIAAYLKAATESSCPELLDLAIKNIKRAREANNQTLIASTAPDRFLSSNF